MPLPDRRPRWLLLSHAALTGMAALGAAVALTTSSAYESLDQVWWIALASVAITASQLALSGLWTATGAYAVVFWCFHFGLLAGLASGLVAPGDLSVWDQSWALGPFATDAALLALTGSLALASGASLVRGMRAQRMPAPAVDRRGAHPHGAAGSVLVLGASAVWSGVVVLTGGIGGFFVSYAEYLQMTAEFSDVLALAWLVLGVGIVLTATGRTGRLRRSAIAAFCLVALLALPLGLRGEIFFPAVAALVASARCGRALSLRTAGAIGVALLVLIPAIRQVRSVGLRDLSQVMLEIRPFDALTEMGGSLHPIEKVVRWHAEGEPLEYGGSYWAPIERAARRLLPGFGVLSAEDDSRIMNVVVSERVGGIGFSPVAEAYRNFGAFGVAVVFVMLGGLLAVLDRVVNPRSAVLALATIYLPLLINVRNSFISVPAQCAAGVLIVLGLVAMRHVSGAVVSRPYARAADIRSAI